MPNIESKKALKEKLLDSLQSESIDYDMVLSYASELADNDEGNIRFSVDANIVKRLGEQLVAKKTTAVSELIKNAYDADATSVAVRFKNTEQIGGTIIISDDGNGMTREQLLHGFMKISTSDKEDEPTSPIFKRQRAGKKGIGRFSAQKIGSKLTILTKLSNNSPVQRVDIDWDNFIKNKNLITISNKYNTYIDDNVEKGTTLIISDVKEAWNLENIKTTFSYVLSIMKYDDSGVSKRFSLDPGFKVSMLYYNNMTNAYENLINDKTEIFNEADAVIEAYVSNVGVGEVIINSKRHNIHNEVIKIDESESLSGFIKLNEVSYKLKVHYFALAKDDKNSRKVGAHLRENGGIRLYRNDFRLAPYGEKYNDWLKLDDSSRRRTILPPHANGNFIGFVELHDAKGDIFEETSSREGLIENDDFRTMRDFTYKAITMGVTRVSSARNIKVTSSQRYSSGANNSDGSIEKELRGSFDTVQKKIQDVFKDVIKTAESINNTQSNSDIDENKNTLTAVITNTKELEAGLASIERLTSIVIDENSLYKVLSAMGLAIGEFTHEIQLFLANLDLNTNNLLDYFKDNDEFLPKISNLNENLGMLKAYTDFFDSTMRKNSQREKQVLEMRTVIDGFFESMSSTMQRKKYQVEITYDSWGIWTKPVHSSELSSVMINLFTNATKAIYRAGANPGKIRIHVKTTLNEIIIHFEDNGDGILFDKRELVFNPLYTTSIPAAAYSSDEISLRGMGLGLAIVKDIITGMEGEIIVTDASEGYNTCIQITIPRALDEEVPDDAY